MAQLAVFTADCNDRRMGSGRIADQRSGAGIHPHRNDPSTRRRLEVQRLDTRAYPADRWGTVDDLVGPAIFVASPASSYMNGQVLFVDGGMTAVV